MSKHTRGSKIQLVLEYLSGKTGGREKVTKKYDIPGRTLKSWIEKYKSGGFDSLSRELKNNKFTGEFKLSVIQYRQIKNISFRKTAGHFNLVNESIVCRWERTYQEHSLSGLGDNRERPSKDMTRSNEKSKLNTPVDESEGEELVRSREESKFLKVKIIYEKGLQALLLEEEAGARKRQG